jgi:hypothetical protein
VAVFVNDLCFLHTYADTTLHRSLHCYRLMLAKGRKEDPQV